MVFRSVGGAIAASVAAQRSIAAMQTPDGSELQQIHQWILAGDSRLTTGVGGELLSGQTARFDIMVSEHD
jgi:hypothetical protein